MCRRVGGVALLHPSQTMLQCLPASPSALLLVSKPRHLAQMLVDDIGDVTITNDGATILKLLEVEHPAAKVRSGGSRVA